MYAREEEKKRDSRKKTPLYLTIVPSPEKEPHVHLQAPSFPSPPPPGLSVYSRPTASASSWLWLLVARCSSLQYGPASASPAGDALKYRDSAFPQCSSLPTQRGLFAAPRLPPAGPPHPDRRPRRGQDKHKGNHPQMLHAHAQQRPVQRRRYMPNHMLHTCTADVPTHSYRVDSKAAPVIRA